MKLASLKSKKSRDGILCLVNKSLTRAIELGAIAPTLQIALERWKEVAPALKAVYQSLNEGRVENSFSFNAEDFASPLPRAYQWADGSAYLNHVALVRKARGAEMPEEFLQDPLLYQGGSDAFLGPRDPIIVSDESYGIDFEAEIAIITDDVPMGISAKEAQKHIKLLLLVNDVSLRHLIPGELSKGFGFFQSKPASSFSPLALSPDELAEFWDPEGRVHLPLYSYLNDRLFGAPLAGEGMHFSFSELIAHAAKTRDLSAGTIIGSGTVSNEDTSKGSSCIAEKRMLETLEKGKAETSFMRFGDKIRIEMRTPDGQSLFGAIEQSVLSLQSLKRSVHETL